MHPIKCEAAPTQTIRTDQTYRCFGCSDSAATIPRHTTILRQHASASILIHPQGINQHPEKCWDERVEYSGRDRVQPIPQISTHNDLRHATSLPDPYQSTHHQTELALKPGVSRESKYPTSPLECSVSQGGHTFPQ